MKGLGWDDLGRGTSSLTTERRFFSKLKSILRESYDIEYEWEEDTDRFYSMVFSKSYDFVTVDLLDAKSVPIGRDIAINIRTRMTREGDPEFPVFLLSSAPEVFRNDDVFNYRITPVAKDSQAVALVAQQLTYHLKETGRFGRPKEVLIFARHALKSLAGRALDRKALDQLCSIVATAGCIPVEVTPESFSLDILVELRKRVQEAGRVIVFLTRDERLESGNASLPYVARPNVYLELGIALGVRGGNRKLVLVQEAGTYLPTDVGSHQAIAFEGDVLSIRERLIDALQKPI